LFLCEYWVHKLSRYLKSYFMEIASKISVYQHISNFIKIIYLGYYKHIYFKCQQSCLPFYIYFLKCWHRLKEPSDHVSWINKYIFTLPNIVPFWLCFNIRSTEEIGEEGLSLSTHRPVTTKNTGKYDSIGDKKEKSKCTHKIS
jgi:hypothetical protein